MIRKLGALLGAGALAVLTGVLAPVPARAATTTPQAATVTLQSINPRSPDPDNAKQGVRIIAKITNNTDNTYSDVQFSLQRTTTYSQQSALDAIIAHPVTADDTNYWVPNPLDTHQQLLPRASITVSYLTNVADLCLCFHGIYAYSLVASGATTADGGFSEIGRSQLLLPSFPNGSKPQPVNVAWVWPLLDRPHRSIDNDVFTDEALAAEIAAGGRLDRALQVPERMAGKVRMTLVVDPDLLDSLAVMAGKEGYRVQRGTGTVPGTGGALARAWLARFKAVTAKNDIVFTGYADPDVNALARSGQPYNSNLDNAVQSRIAPYLDSIPSTSLAWPAGEALNTRAMNALVAGGVNTVLLSDAALPGGNKTEPRPDALSPLPTTSGNANALVLDSSLQATFTRAISATGTTNDIQTLLAQLAIRAEQGPDHSHFVVLAPGRYADVDPARVASLMTAELGTGWSGSISVPQALASVTPVDRGALNTAAENANAEISQEQLNQASDISDAVASMGEALHDNDAAAQLLGGFALGIQRAESSAWRTNPNGGEHIVDQLQARIDSITGSVHLVTPAVGTYTLSSSTSPIVVTVANQLSKPVTVRVVVRLADPGIGFTAPAATTQTIPAQSIEPIRIQTKTERLGKFQVNASLQTPDGRSLGMPIQLSLQATAIGKVTKIITIVAVAVLVLALVRRLVKRIRNGPTPKPRPALPVATT